MDFSCLRPISTSLFAALLATSALTTASGCQPDGGPSIEGASPAEAAQITAEVSCGYFARCGVPQTTCSDSTDPNDDDDGCETVFHPLSMDECLDEAEPILDEAFGCAELDVDLRAEIDDCLAAFETSECAGPGDSAGDGLGMPEGCAEVLEALVECADQEDDRASSPGRPAQPDHDDPVPPDNDE